MDGDFKNLTDDMLKMQSRKVSQREPRSADEAESREASEPRDVQDGFGIGEGADR